MFAKQYATQQVGCISIGYQGRTIQDESVLAAEFARQEGLRHHRVELTTEQVVRDFPVVCLRRDEPISDLAGSSIYALAAASRDLGYPVLFSGLGGDELFWGYEWHRRSVVSNERLRRLRAGHAGVLDYLSFRSPPLSWVGLLQWLQDGGGLISELRQRDIDRALPRDQLRFWDMTFEFRQASAAFAGITGPAMRSSTFDPARHFRGPQFWADIGVSLTALICSTYLRSNGLGQTDRLSMACSVESRVPFADARLAEVVVGLRKSHPDHLLARKSWLRNALRGVVPDAVMRRRKRGFTPPWRRWTNALMLAYGDQLSRGTLVELGLLDREAAGRLRRGIDGLGRPVPLAIPSLVLELWLSGIRSVCSSPSTSGDLPPMLPRGPHWRD
jgi:asparagine synthase (glutamine-hydrolysing)